MRDICNNKFNTLFRISNNYNKFRTIKTDSQKPEAKSN